MPSKEQFSRYFNDLKSYFNVSADLEPQADTEASIRSGVSFKGSQLLILVFAIFVASLGLNTDNGGGDNRRDAYISADGAYNRDGARYRHK